jgi:hypothetical protein
LKLLNAKKELLIFRQISIHYKTTKRFGNMGAFVAKVSSNFSWSIAPTFHDSTLGVPRTEKGPFSCQPDSLKEATTEPAPILGSKQLASTSSDRTDTMYSNVLSRGGASRSNSFDSYDDEVHIPNLLPQPLESTDSFRVVQKKPKKLRRGRRLGLAAVDSNSDTATNSSRANSASPSPNKLHLRPTITNATQVSREDNLPIQETPSRKNKRIGNQLSQANHGDHQFDANPTPTQARFNSNPTPTQTHFGSFQLTTPSYKALSNISTIDIDPAEVSDTESTKGRTKEVMSQLSMALGGISHASVSKDAFDSVEWDPELPTADGADSPEPVTVKLQPVAYTTVGSLVDPNAKPQFSAPNRIQREGAVRQPLLSMMNATQRPYDGFYQTRGPPPPLSMASSMAYAQNIAKSPVHASSIQNLTPTETSMRTNRMTGPYQIPPLTDKEVDVLKKMQLPQLGTSNMNGTPSTPTPSSSSKLSAVAPSFEKKEQMLEKTRGIGSSTMASSLNGSFTGGGLGGLNGALGSRMAADNSRNASIAVSVSSFDNAFTKLVTGKSPAFHYCGRFLTSLSY